MLATPWLIIKPRLALLGLFTALLAGQVFRLPLPGQAGGLLISDAATSLILLAALAQLLRHRRPVSKITACCLLLTTPFLFWSLFSLTINAAALPASQTLIAFFYWLRLTSHLLLLPALLFLFQEDALRRLAYRGLLLTAAALALLGFVQLWLVPNLSGLPGRWDPHSSRLVSTWLDPNFFGAFVAMLLPVHISLILRRRGRVSRRTDSTAFLAWSSILSRGKVAGASFLAIALILTQSRSALLALILAALMLSPLILIMSLRRATLSQRRALIASLTLLLLLTLAAGLFLHERLLGLFYLDDTVALRFNALRAAWPLAAQHSFLGVGYNAYQFAARAAGLISDFSLHSRAGTDNSYLTLLATTGLPGLVLFMLPLFYLGHRLLRLALAGHHLAFAGLLALFTLLVHANFVNSLLYSHLLITLALILSLALYADNSSPRQC